jgi:hypothetical protein
VLLTGLLLGAGPGPLHSLITTLQELRNAVAGLADLARGSAFKRVKEAQVSMIPQVTLARAGVLAPSTPQADGDGASAVETLEPQVQNLVSMSNLRIQRQAQRLLRFR